MCSSLHYSSMLSVLTLFFTIPADTVNTLLFAHKASFSHLPPLFSCDSIIFIIEMSGKSKCKNTSTHGNMLKSETGTVHGTECPLDYSVSISYGSYNFSCAWKSNERTHMICWAFSNTSKAMCSVGSNWGNL